MKILTLFVFLSLVIINVNGYFFKSLGEPIDLEAEIVCDKPFGKNAYVILKEHDNLGPDDSLAKFMIPEGVKRTKIEFHLPPHDDEFFSRVVSLYYEFHNVCYQEPVRNIYHNSSPIYLN